MLTFGADPEFACALEYDDKKGGYYKIIPPAALIQDYKIPFTVNNNNKRVLFSSDYYGDVIEDGAAIEINPKPEDTLIGVKNNTLELLKGFSLYLRNMDIIVRFPMDPIGYFDVDKYWKNRDESFQDCVRFGCDPDIFPEYYLELGLEKEKPHEIDVSKHSYRYFGGHIHVGTKTKFDTTFCPIVFDFTLGLINAALHRQPEQIKLESARLQYYGHPGRCRIQKHGYEYRPPSNYWLFSSNSSLHSLEASIHLAMKIINADMQKEFFFFVRDFIPDMWNICLTLDKDAAKKMYSDVALRFCMERCLVKLSEIKSFTKLSYL